MIRSLHQKTLSLIDRLVINKDLFIEKPSLAAAALFAAIRRSNKLSLWSESLELATGYKVKDFNHIFNVTWRLILPLHYLKEYSVVIGQQLSGSREKELELEKETWDIFCQIINNDSTLMKVDRRILAQSVIAASGYWCDLGLSWADIVINKLKIPRSVIEPVIKDIIKICKKIRSGENKIQQD